MWNDVHKMETRKRLSCPETSGLGPYKATKLWNDAVTAFRQGVPRGKHRRFMRTAEDCFLGSTAVDWLMEYLKKQKDFGSDVTRQQTTHLLNKFYRAGIFEEIQVSRRGRNKADFSDSNRLYRLLPVSPSKGTRVPLAVRTSNITPQPLKISKDEKRSQPDKEEEKERTSVRKEETAVTAADPALAIDRLPQCHLMGRFLTGSQIGEIWKTAALSRLKKVLGVGSLEDILQDYTVEGAHVRHNCIFLNKSGIVTNIQPQDQLPHWVLSAMKCLARWPEKAEGDLPSYPGFEKDVFGVVRDYFIGLQEPLITYELYDIIINVFVQACNQLPRHSSPFSHAARDEKRFGYSLWSDSSLENVILNLTRNTGNLLAGRPASNLHASHSSQHLAPSVRANSQSTLGQLSDLSSLTASKQFRSNPDLQVSRYETAFGPENQTVTRVYFCNGLATDFHHNSVEEQEALSPVETHFDVVTDNSQRQSTHISFDRVSRSSSLSRNKPSDLDEESLKNSVGQSRSYNSYQRQQKKLGAHDSATFASLSEPRQEPEPADKKPPSPSWDKGRKPPPYRRTRAERHHTFSGSQFGMGREMERGVLDDWDRQMSASISHLPGLKPVGADSQPASISEAASRQRTARSLGLSSGRGAKRPSSLYLNFPQSGLHEERATKALQVVCLFLPPASRRKLHFLLKLMSKMAANPFLTFDPNQSTRSLVLGTFQHAVLRAPEETDLDAVLVFQLVSFLVDHHMDIMAVPTDMKDVVEDRLRDLEKPQIVYSPQDRSTLRFAKPVSMEQYEKEKIRHSHTALLELLDSIVRDENMADREKRRRLKQFQKTYPQLYKQRFPDTATDPLQADLRSRGKPPLFVRPLQRLRGLRV
ncbi:DEP domain-containing protein 1A-like [Babylonia areolata]|uniref:DEP domain-containing protein 1A-like n=1 Tax=Babylonia areolata TaxID=304850 RepID=UPI003FD013C1